MMTMKLIKSTLIFSSAILFAAACASNTNVSPNTASQPIANKSAETPAATPADELAGAKEIYSKRCIGCHRETGEGGEKDVDGKKIKVPSFKAPDTLAESDDEYTGQIIHGGDGMPAFKGKLTDEEIKNLVRLVRRDFQGKK